MLTKMSNHSEYHKGFHTVYLKVDWAGFEPAISRLRIERSYHAEPPALQCLLRVISGSFVSAPITVDCRLRIYIIAFKTGQFLILAAITALEFPMKIGNEV